MTPAEFKRKWARYSGKETSAYQEHFNDLCALLGQPSPATADPTGSESFCFQKRVIKDEEDLETALVAAVRRGQIDVVKRIGIDPTRDDVTALINEYCFWPNPELLEFLIKLGADVRNAAGENSAMHWAFSSFEWSLDSLFRDYSRTEAVLRCIEFSLQTVRDGTLTIRTGLAASAERLPKLLLTK